MGIEIGVSMTRISTVPKWGQGRTSHQISCAVWMNPVEIRCSVSQLYSDQFRSVSGRPAVGRDSISFDRYELSPVSTPHQFGEFDERASSVGRCRSRRSHI